QLAIEEHIIEPADHDDLGAGIAHVGELIEPGQDLIAAAIGLDHDDIGRRRGAVGLIGGNNAAHLHLEMGPAQPAVLAGRLHGGRGLDSFAKGLHRYARRGCDVLGYGGLWGFGRGHGRAAHGYWPTVLILPLSASGYWVAGLSPR